MGDIPEYHINPEWFLSSTEPSEETIKLIVDRYKTKTYIMIENKVIHNDTVTSKSVTRKLETKSKKPNTSMLVPNNHYPENRNILKKPVGKTHKCSCMFKGIKLKKNIKKTKKAIKTKKIKKEIKKGKKF